MLQLQNQTPFLAEKSLLNDESGVETLYIVIKATFEARNGWVVSDEPLPIWQSDCYYGEPGESALQYPSEQHLGKTATDILVEGDICAPEGNVVGRQCVSVSVGEVRKDLIAFGDRVWSQGRISSPRPFARMPLRYEYSYGGAVQREGRWLVYDERNPVGRFALGRCPNAELDGEPLPNIEQPDALVQSPDDCPEPAGLGPIAPHWLPRARYAGTYDQQWRQTRAPFAPEDFSRRFFNVATPGLIYPGWLQGGEPFLVTGMRPEGNWQGQLPNVRLAVRASLSGDASELEPHLETVLLQPEECRVSMTWRAQIPCPKKALDIASVQVSIKR